MHSVLYASNNKSQCIWHSLNSSFTHLAGLVLITAIVQCIWFSSSSSFRQLFGLIPIKNKFWCKLPFQQLFHMSLGFYTDQEQIQTATSQQILSQSSWVVYSTVTKSKAYSLFSKALLDISWVLYWSETYFNAPGQWWTAFSHTLGLHIDQEQIPITLILMKKLFYTSLHSYTDQEDKTTVYPIQLIFHTISGSCTDSQNCVHFYW